MLFSVATYCLANFLLFTFCELATYEPIMDETASFKSVKSGSHFRRTRSFKRELFSTIFNFSRHFCVTMLVNICVYSKRKAIQVQVDQRFAERRRKFLQESVTKNIPRL